MRSREGDRSRSGNRVMTRVVTTRAISTHQELFISELQAEIAEL